MAPEEGFSSPSKRLTLGFLTFYQNQMMQGIFKAAEKHDVNIISFFHNVEAKGHKYDINSMFRLIKEQNLDGLLFLGWIRIIGVDIDAFRRYFDPLPMYSLGAGFDDVHSIYIDGAVYLRQLLVHLIEVHGCRRIVFISPIMWDERVNTYKEVMQQYGLYDPKLIIAAEDLQSVGFDLTGRAKLITEVLLDKRNISFDAISSLYSDESVNLLAELQARGIRIPEDVKVIGNENKENEKYCYPSLTTVFYPFWELGYQGCEKFIELLTSSHKKDIPLRTAIPGKIILRESCGCVSHSIKIAECGPAFTSHPAPLSSADQKSIQSQLCSLLPHNIFRQEELLEAFFTSYKTKNNSLFLKALENCVCFYHPCPEEAACIQDFISCLHKIVIPRLYPQKNDIIWAEDLFHQSRVILEEKIITLMGEERMNARQMNQALQDLSQEMIITFDFKELMDTLAANFPKINIPSCYLLLHKGKKSVKDYTLIFEYVKGERVVPPRTLSSGSTALPENLFPQNSRYTLLCLFLGVEDEHLGLAIFEPGPLLESIYQSITIQLSTTIKGIILLDRLENANLELKMVQDELVDKAHQAGMADIAAGTLHNVGNILNSINASNQVMQEILKSSPLEDIKLANALLEKNIDTLQDFIRNNPKGKKLMRFYLKISSPFLTMHEQLQGHLSRLEEKTNLVNEIIIAQQTYASAKPILEEIDLEEIIEDTLKMQLASLEKYNIRIIRYFKAVPKVTVQKAKLFHILINLFNNAKDAMQNTPEGERKLILTLRADEEFVDIVVRDTGIGIPSDLLSAIFTSGFTTKKEGHGFGLHSCANYMTEMGGKFWAESAGPGEGATFILRFKQDKKES